MKQKEIKKEIVLLSDKELLQRIQEEKNKLVKLKLQHAVSPLENPMEIRNTRKTIARLLTELNKRKKLNNNNKNNNNNNNNNNNSNKDKK